MTCTAACRPLMYPAVLALAVATTVFATAAHADALGDAIAKGKSAIELRYRFENVDQDGIASEANASTLRTRVRYATSEWMQMSAMVEMDNISRIGDDRYNDTRNGKTTYPIVVDPDGTDLNQALIKYMGLTNTAITLGRQRLNLDNQRFIGSVGWRQNEQTLDAALVEFKGIDRLTATWGFVSSVQRIWGPDAGTPPPVLDGESHLLNVKYARGEPLTAVAYAYLLDFDNAAALSSKTVGLSLSGKLPAGDFKFGYTAEFAQQSDYADQPVSYDANYGLAEISFGKGPWEVQLGYELLGSDGGVAAVQTPLATLHKFQGWADKFLTTPAVGLIDTSLGGTVKLAGYGFTLVAHQYEGDSNGADYGDEINVQIARTFAKRYTLTAKYADYSMGDVVAVKDTAKAWLMAEAKF